MILRHTVKLLQQLFFPIERRYDCIEKEKDSGGLVCDCEQRLFDISAFNVLTTFGALYSMMGFLNQFFMIRTARHFTKSNIFF